MSDIDVESWERFVRDVAAETGASIAEVLANPWTKAARAVMEIPIEELERQEARRERRHEIRDRRRMWRDAQTSAADRAYLRRGFVLLGGRS